MSNAKLSSRSQLLRLVVCGMMIAVDVVLARLASLNTTTERLGLSLFAVAIVAYLYGPVAAMAVHALSDLLGALLFPNGPIFLGFTLTAALIGLIYGFCLHRQVSFWRILLAVVITQAVCTLGLNTLWLSMLYNKGFLVFLPGRLIQAAIVAPVQLVGLPFLLRALKKGVLPMLNKV